MSRILGEEHDDCDNWAKWCWDLELGRGYPKRWPVPMAPGDHIETNKATGEWERHILHLEQMNLDYHEHRAVRTDGLFRVWLDECRLYGHCWGKRHFMTLHKAYLLRRNVIELEVRESLRALADLKARFQRVNNPLALRQRLSYSGGQGELPPQDTQEAA